MTNPSPGADRISRRGPEEPWDDYDVMFEWWRQDECIQTTMHISIMRWHQRMQPEPEDIPV